MPDIKINFIGKDEVSNVMKGIGGSFAKLGKAAAFGVAGAVVGGAAAIGGAVAASVDFASQMKQAQNDLQAELGVTEERAAELGKVATDVFKNNFGDSLDEAKSAVAETQKQLGKFGLADKELQKVTEGAFAIKDVFGQEIGGSEGVISAVNVLMDKFGLSSTEALDFVTTGFQKGLNSSDDFLASITEYGVLFGQGGASASQFFGLLESGLQSGVLGTDKAADLFKEFQIKFLEGGDDIEEALGSIGLDWGSLTGQISSGQTTVANVFETINSRVAGMSDPIARNITGVALMGTMFEDLGADAVGAISLTSTELAKSAGATDALGVKYENMGAVFEGFKRSALVAIAPIGQTILELANDIMPKISEGFALIEPFISTFANSVANIIRLLVTGDFSGGIFGLSEDHPLIGFLLRAREAFISLGGFLKETVLPILQNAGKVLGTFLVAQVKVLAAFWTDVLSPALVQVQAFVTTNVIPALTALSDWFIRAVPPMMDAVKVGFSFFTTTILPIVIGFVNSVINWFMKFKAQAQPIVEAFAKRFSEVWQQAGPVIMDALQRIGAAFGQIIRLLFSTEEGAEGTSTTLELLGNVLDAIVIAVQAVAVVLQGIAWAFEKVAEAIRIAKQLGDQFAQVISAIGDKIPDILKPGSPPPLAIALASIGEAASMANTEMDKLGSTLGGVGRMGGIENQISNVGVLPPGGSNGHSQVNNNQQMNLTINSSAPTESMAADFDMMKSRLAVV